MKIAQINMVPHGSTGKVMLQIAQVARENGHEVITFSTTPFDKKKKVVPLREKHHVVFGSVSENKRHYYLGSLLGRNGCYSKRGTKELIEKLKDFDPDMIHLHNLHKFCIHLPLLFGYLKKSRAKVVWTMHDCWPFTGQCPHFVLAGCDKWKTECHHCPQFRGYPKSLVDNSRHMYRLKKKLFTDVDNMTMVSPSCWLGNLIKQSFLKNAEVRVIMDGIDLTVFYPREDSVRETYNIDSQKKILLGVAFGWGKRKGLDVFVELAKRLDPKEYQIVLVGTDETVEQMLPSAIIPIRRTENPAELCQLYTAADLFVNTTREEVLGLVNLEALSCGTPVLTFDTGGSPECIDSSCGSVVPCDDIDALESEIIRICKDKPYSKEACISRAQEFDIHKKFKEYIDLYEELFKEN